MGAARERFDALLAGREGGAPAWLPLLDPLAARLSGADYRALSSDAGLWAAGLMKAGELLAADALVVGFDFTLTAEACGATLDWSSLPPVLLRAPSAIDAGAAAALRQAAMIETVRRLGGSARARFGLVAAIVGPATLAQQLCAELPLEEGLKRVKGVHTLLTTALLEARPDLILLLERWSDAGEESSRARQRAFGTLRNLAAHYDVPLALYVERWSAGQMPELAALRLPFYVLGPGSGEALAAARTLAGAATGAGLSLPESDAAGAAALVAAVRAARGEGHRLFLTTAPATAHREDPAVLRALAAQLHAGPA